MKIDLNIRGSLRTTHGPSCSLRQLEWKRPEWIICYRVTLTIGYQISRARVVEKVVFERCSCAADTGTLNELRDMPQVASETLRAVGVPSANDLLTSV